MPAPGRPPAAFSLTCRRLGIRPSPNVLCVSVARQEVTWFVRPLSRPWAPFTRLKTFRASTSRFGVGQVRDTCRTPLGLHRVARKIGAGWPIGTAFKARQAVGYTWAGLPKATITHRILWLEGLEPGLNLGGEVDTFSRYIYIHGLADEPTLGRPASHGCIHLAAADLMPLFDRITAGTLVWVAATP